jgi:hypothetical protein
LGRASEFLCSRSLIAFIDAGLSLRRIEGYLWRETPEAVRSDEPPRRQINPDTARPSFWSRKSVRWTLG